MVLGRPYSSAATPTTPFAYSPLVAPTRADVLADLVLLDHDGREVRLGDLWSERPVALVWLRHYG
jgi:hypothetical protein